MKTIVDITGRLVRMSVVFTLAVALGLIKAGIASAHVYRLESGFQQAPAQSHALLIGIVVAAVAAAACASIVFGLRSRRHAQRPTVVSPVAGPSTERQHPKAA